MSKLMLKLRATPALRVAVAARAKGRLQSVSDYLRQLIISDLETNAPGRDYSEPDEPSAPPASKSRKSATKRAAK